LPDEIVGTISIIREEINMSRKSGREWRAGGEKSIKEAEAKAKAKENVLAVGWCFLC
jgi:hypothetical protein